MYFFNLITYICINEYINQHEKIYIKNSNTIRMH